MNFKTRLLNFFRQIFKINFLEKFILFFTKAKNAGSFFTKFPANHYQYKPGTLRAVTRNKIQYSLDISDSVQWYIYFGFYELSKNKLFSMFRKDDVVFDIGANIGEVTLNAAQRVGSGGQVFSFEPDSLNFSRLQKNVSLNSFSNITLVNKGLGTKSEELKLYNPFERNAGQKRILKDEKITADFSVIKIISLDEYLQNNSIRKIDVIKIDVEGFEMNVLRGAETTIKKFRPKFFIELDDDNLRDQQSSAKELISFLISFQYKISDAEKNTPVNANDNFSKCHYDIIALPE